MGALKPQAPAEPGDDRASARPTRPSRRLAGLSIGVYGSGGAPWHHLALLAVNGATVAVVRAEDVAAGRLADLDALVVPGGGAAAMAGLIAPLGEAGASAIRSWVERGGCYVGSCAGSVLPVALTGAADAAVPAARCLRLVDVPLANTGDEILGGLSSPGVGRIRVRLDLAHPFSEGLPEVVELVHYNGPLFDVARAGRAGHAGSERSAGRDVTAFAWPLEATEAFTHAERFLEPSTSFGVDAAPGSTTGAREPVPTLERCIASGAATGVFSTFGNGRVLLFGSHPEFGLGPLGLGWADGETLLVRALEVTLRDQGKCERPLLLESEATWATCPARPDESALALAREAVDSLRRASQRFSALSAEPPRGWLEPGYAASFHGTPASTAWGLELTAASEACAAAAADLADLAALIEGASAGEVGALSAADARWLDDAPRSGQDFGAMGLLQIASRLHSQLDEAERSAARPPVRPAHAYDLFDSHPFHLAMGSYLSAAGMAAAALLAVALIAAGHGTVGAASRRLLWKGTTCS